MVINKSERNSRINTAMGETKRILVKAKTRLSNSKKVLNNERKGVYGRVTQADINSKKKWVKEDIESVKRLETHLKKLQRMK
jgi:hypothetical protein